MKYLMLNTENKEIRYRIADFISDLYTSYTEREMHEGEEELIYTMRETKGMLLKEYETYNNLVKAQEQNGEEASNMEKTEKIQ